MTQPRTLPILAAAAVLAAVVSFLVVGLAKGESAPAAPADDARLAALEARLADTERQLVQARSQAETTRSEAVAVLRKELEQRIAGLETGLAAQTQLSTSLEQLQRESSAAVTELRSQYKAFNGRIEQNYQRLRAAERRLEELAGK